MGVRVAADDLPDHLMLQHQHNINRGAEAEAQYAPIAAKARMFAEPARMVGPFGGPVGAALGETAAQTIEQAGGARQRYDPLAIGGQVAIPLVAKGLGKIAQKGFSRTKSVAPTISEVPQPVLSKEPQVTLGSYFGPDRRRSMLDPAVLEENRLRSVQGGIERRVRRQTIGEGANPSFPDYMRYVRGEPGAADFLDNIDRNKPKP